MALVKNEPHRRHPNSFTIVNTNILLLPTLRIGFSLSFVASRHLSDWMESQALRDMKAGVSPGFE